MILGGRGAGLEGVPLSRAELKGPDSSWTEVLAPCFLPTSDLERVTQVPSPSFLS